MTALIVPESSYKLISYRKIKDENNLISTKTAIIMGDGTNTINNLFDTFYISLSILISLPGKDRMEY